MDWESLATKKRSDLEASIPPEWRIKTHPADGSVMSFPRTSGHLALEELVITEYSATELVQKLATGKLTSVAVTRAFCKRAALAHQLVSRVPYEVMRNKNC
jgi:amidase